MISIGGDDDEDDVDVFVIDICDMMLMIFYVHTANHVVEE